MKWKVWHIWRPPPGSCLTEQSTITPLNEHAGATRELSRSLIQFGKLMRGEKLSYRDFIQQVTETDATEVLAKDREYAGSWLKRGGVGAFMMLARKWDRIEERVGRGRTMPVGDGGETRAADKYDIIQHALIDPREEGVIDDIRDLRRYLVLVEAELIAQVKARPDVEHPFGYEPDEEA